MNDCANDPFTDCVGGGNKPHSPWCYWYVGTGECEDCENGHCTMNCSSASLSPTHKPNLASAPAGDGDAIEAAARAMCDRVNGIGDYDENIEQRRPGWTAQAKAALDAAALARPRAAVGEREALIAELLPLIQKAASPNGWEWMFPLRVKPVDGKPTIVSHKGGNLFRGYIGTWQEADMLVALANAAPRIILALQSPPAKVEG